MGKAPKFRITNYAGGVPSHPQPEAAGMLTFTPAFRWELHFAGTTHHIFGGVARFAFDVESTGAKSCKVVLRDQNDPAVSTSFELPDTPAAKLETELANQQRLLAAANKRDALVKSGQWWQVPGTFKCLDITEKFTVPGTAYHGGWSRHLKTHGSTNRLKVDKRGIGLRGKKTIFTIPWAEVVDVTVASPEAAAKGVTATRTVALSVFSPAAKKTTKGTVVIVTTANGDQAVFQSENTPPFEVSRKLIPLAARVRKAAQRRAGSPLPMPAAGPPRVADELAKLAKVAEYVVVSKLGDHAKAWDEMFDCAALRSPFLRSWWLDAISKPSSRYLLVSDVTGRLIGGMPFEVRHTRRGLAAQVAGQAQGADHMDAVVAPGSADEVARAVVDWLCSGEVKRVDLVGLSETCILRDALPSQLAWFSWDVSPWAVLPASSEEYWAQRPSSLRRYTAYTSRRLERAGVVYDRPTSDDARVVAAEYARLRKFRWGYKSLVPEPAQFVLALERGLTTGELVVHRLSIDGRAIVVDFWFHVGGVASCMRNARDVDKQWHGSGNLLRGHAIEHAIARGEHEIDLLRGGESYKYEWVDRQRQLGQIQGGRPATLRDIAGSAPSLLRRRVRGEAARVRARFR